MAQLHTQQGLPPASYEEIKSYCMQNQEMFQNAREQSRKYLELKNLCISVETWVQLRTNHETCNGDGTTGCTNFSEKKLPKSTLHLKKIAFYKVILQITTQKPHLIVYVVLNVPTFNPINHESIFYVM